MNSGVQDAHEHAPAARVRTRPQKLAGFNQVTWTQQNGIRELVETKQRAHTYRAPKKIPRSVTFCSGDTSLCETFPPCVWSYARLTSGKNSLRQAGWRGVKVVAAWRPRRQRSSAAYQYALGGRSAPQAARQMCQAARHLPVPICNGATNGGGSAGATRKPEASLQGTRRAVVATVCEESLPPSLHRFKPRA